MPGRRRENAGKARREGEQVNEGGPAGDAQEQRTALSCGRIHVLSLEDDPADEISLEGRNLAVAGVLEAMSSHRPYRAALGLEPALAKIRDGSGRLYDTDVVTACAKVFEEEGF